MKRLSCLIIIFILASSLLCGIWVNKLGRSGGEVTLYFEPKSINVERSQNFSVKVCISNVENLYKWTLSLYWNASIIELEPASSSAFIEESFLKSAGITLFRVSTYTVGSGYVSFISCELLQPVGASGSGPLFSVRFRSLADGKTEIRIANVVLYNNLRQTLPYITQNCSVSVVSVFHDLMVTLHTSSYLFSGKQAVIEAFVKNAGEVAEKNVNANILINGSAVYSKVLSYIQPGETHNLTYLWYPLKLGIYNVSVYVQPVFGEKILENNFQYRFVKVVSEKHDVSVSLECPRNIFPGQTVFLKITVVNLGGFDEENVKVVLTICSSMGQLKETWVIPMLELGNYHVLNYLWQPKMEGSYNVTVTVSLTEEDWDASNNFYTTQVVVSRKILIVSDDGGYYQKYGTSLNEFMSVLDTLQCNYDVWRESINGTISSSSFLEQYDIVIWTCGDYAGWVINPREQQAIIEYVNRGGNLLIEGEKFVSNLVKREEYSLLNSVLYVQYKAYSVTTTGFMPSTTHPITADLTEVGWLTMPTRCPDGVIPFGYGFSVMQYAGTNYSAITVVDGSETGKGSVVYFSFSLFNLPRDYRTVLVKNCIGWFNRFGLSSVLGLVLHASPNTVSFIYSKGSDSSLEFDFVAGGMVYALSSAEQRQLFDDVDLADVSTDVVCLFGSPRYHKIVASLNATGKLPVILYQNGNAYIIAARNSTLYTFNYNDLTRGSAFILQICKDGDKILLVVYGLDSRGMWAAGLFLSRAVIRNLRSFCEPFYVFKWIDQNGDLIPQLDEIGIISS